MDLAQIQRTSPVADTLSLQVEVVVPIFHAEEKLTRENFGTKTKPFSFDGAYWHLVLQYEGENLVLTLEMEHSLDRVSKEMFCGAGILDNTTEVLRHWQESTLSFQNLYEISRKVWTGPCKSYLLQNGKTLFPGDATLWIFFAMSRYSSFSGAFGEYRKEPIEKCQISTASNPRAVTENVEYDSDEDSLSLYIRGGDYYPVGDILLMQVEFVVRIHNAEERLTREDFRMKTRTADFYFDDHYFHTVLQYEGENLVLTLEMEFSFNRVATEMLCGVGILDSKTKVLHHWQESTFQFQRPGQISRKVWIGPSKSYLLQNGKTLFPSDALWICIVMSRYSPLSGAFEQYRKEPTEKDQISTASNPRAVTEKGVDGSKEDSLPPNIRALRTLSKNLKDLYLEDKDHDVQIMVGNKTFRAHRTILKARSPVLSAMFSNDTSEAHTGEVRLEDCHADDFAVFLLFLYSGTSEGLTSDNVLPVYDIADKYDVPELVEACTQHMLSNMTVHTVSDIIGLALKHSEGKLLQEATDFFVQNAEEIFPTVEWQRFLGNNPTQANELVIKSVSFIKSQNA